MSEESGEVVRIVGININYKSLKKPDQIEVHIETDEKTYSEHFHKTFPFAADLLAAFNCKTPEQLKEFLKLGTQVLYKWNRYPMLYPIPKPAEG